MIRTFLALALLLTLSLHAEDFKVAGLTFKTPVGWTATPPTSNMRAGQWTVPPGKLKIDGGEIVAFYFGQGQGGDTMSNINRWLSQITSPEGAPITAQPQTRAVGKIKITQVEAYGTYAGSAMMPGVPVTPKPGQGFVGVVLEGPQGSVFFRFTGPEALVKTTLPVFNKFIDSVVPSA